MATDLLQLGCLGICILIFHKGRLTNKFSESILILLGNYLEKGRNKMEAICSTNDFLKFNSKIVIYGGGTWGQYLYESGRGGTLI